MASPELYPDHSTNEPTKLPWQLYGFSDSPAHRITPNQLIKRPKGEAGRDFNLKAASRLPIDTYNRCYQDLTYYADHYLDVKKTYKYQELGVLALTVKKCKESHPLLRLYESDWLICDMLKVYLTGTHKKWKRTEEEEKAYETEELKAEEELLKICNMLSSNGGLPPGDNFKPQPRKTTKGKSPLKDSTNDAISDATNNANLPRLEQEHEQPNRSPTHQQSPQFSPAGGARSSSPSPPPPINMEKAFVTPDPKKKGGKK
ncbi:hypothetical protein CPB86DRAFT_803049, partial [Serendipita vermifera]